MIWPVFAAVSTLGAAAMPLLHQHFKPDSASMLFWLRIFSFTALLSPVAYLGFPLDWRFYVGTGLIALWMSICDIFYFNAVKKHGAGVVSRLLPGSALVTFFLWFAFDPALIQKYLAMPLHTIAILACLAFGVFCASRLHHDHISRSAVRDIWFVMITAAIGPIAAKLVLTFADKDVAPLAFTMTQGFYLGFAYLAYQLMTRRVPMHVFFGRHSLTTGALIAVASMISIAGKAYAYQTVDNPAYVSMVLFTAPFLIALYERFIGKPDDSDKRAGFGLVLAAAAIILLQIK